MKQYLYAFIVSAITIAAGQAQTPPPRASVSDEVVRISTNLIRIDVSITDRGGKPIRDIRKDEIEIYENGQKQEINGFSFISSGIQASNPGGAGSVSFPPATIGAGSVRRTIALVVDDVSLSWESVHFTEQALRKFVDEQMQDGDLVAVIRTAGGIGVLQQFTTDKRISKRRDREN